MGVAQGRSGDPSRDSQDATLLDLHADPPRRSYLGNSSVMLFKIHHRPMQMQAVSCSVTLFYLLAKKTLAAAV